MHLMSDQPLDLAASLESGQAFRWRRHGQWFVGVIFDNIVQVRQTLFGVEFHSAPMVEEAMAPLLRHYLGLNDDLEAIYRHIVKDHHVADMVARYRGLRILHQEPWECLVAFICSANSNIPRISANVEAVAGHLGQPVSLNGYTRHTFPPPGRVAEAGEFSLRLLGLGFRAKYVAQAALMVAEGRISLEVLRDLPYDEAKERLMEVPGVGEKVADCVLLFSLDKLEAFPVDRWVQRAVEEWYFGGRELKEREVRQWARDYFGPYAGYAQQYLFHGRRLEG